MITTVHPHTARRGRRFVAATAVTAAAALAFGLSSAPALADGATGKYVGNGPGGISVETKTHGKIQTNLFQLKLDDGATLQTYCIDAETAIRSGADYREDAWDTYPGKGDFARPGKVHTVLQSSYPTVDVAALAEQAGIEGLTEEEAVAGTQAAVWHFSNGTELTEGGKHGANVDALYAHLLEKAEQSDTPEPEASLTITPEAAEGAAGETIGEFTVQTSADSVPLKLDAPDGFALVDVESGEPVEAAANGDKLGVKVPEGAEDGEASFSGTITATVEVGRLFRGVDGQPATQTLITADSSETEITASAKVSWASDGGGDTPPDDGDDEEPAPSPSPSTPDEGGGDGDKGDGGKDEGEDKPAPGGGKDQGGGLPVTGGALYGLIGAAVAAVGGGAAAIYFGRKRKASTEV